MINQNIKKLSFNKNTLFPLEHLKKVIEKAKKGQSIFTSDVFFGNEESNQIKTVSTFISNKKQANVHNNKNFLQLWSGQLKLLFILRLKTKQSRL